MYYYFVITVVQVTFPFDILNVFLALGVTSRGLSFSPSVSKKQTLLGFKNLLTS